MYIQFAVHHQHVVAFLFGAFDIGVVGIRVVGIEQYQVAVFVGLGVLHLGLIFAQGHVFAGDILQQGKAFGFLVEFLVREHTKLNKHLDVVPFLGEVLFVGLVQFCQFVSHFLGDIARDLLDVVVALQVTTAHVERDIRTVDHAVQQG